MTHTHTHTHTRLTALYLGLLGCADRPMRKVKPLDFTEARDSEWQWHKLGHMQVCTSLQTDNHASTPPLPTAQLTASKHWRQSRGHCNWQIGLIFIAKLQMYQVRRHTNNCYQTASKCTKSHIQFQKFSPGDTPGPPIGWGLRLQTPVPDWESERWQP